MKMLVVILLGVLGTTGAARFSKTGKNRLVLKSLLYQYSHSEDPSARMATKQCGGDTGIVCCKEEANPPCETSELFANAQEALLFRINQLENFDKRFRRTTSTVKLIRSKGSKFSEFTNTTELLLRALGGDKDNLQCNAQAGDTRVLTNATTTLEILGNCSAKINESCYVYDELGWNEEELEKCGKQRDEILTQVDICYRMVESNTDAKCLCWAKAKEEVDEMKSLKVTVRENVTDKCFKAMEKVSKAINLNSGQKGKCLKQFIKCKQHQDKAIGLINACNDEDTVIIGNFRTMLTEEEDFEEDNDYDYSDEFEWMHNYD